MRTRQLALTAAIAVSAIAPSAAHAATVSQAFDHVETRGPDENGVTYRLPLYPVRFEAAPGEANDVSVATDPARPRAVIFRDAGAKLTPGANCQMIADGVECEPPADGYPDGVDVQLGDGDDRLLVGAGAPSVDAHGGPGADDLTAVPIGSTVDGGPGPDRMSADIVTYADRTAPRSASRSTAKHGEAGEGDNVSASTVFGGGGDDVLVAEEGWSTEAPAPTASAFGRKRRCGRRSTRAAATPRTRTRRTSRS